jgi:hypothetical protein
VTKPPKITHVAIRFNDVIYSLPAPNRHHDVIRHIVETTGVSYVDARGEDQGFLDETGKYLTRRQALKVAKLNSQLRSDRPIWNNELYSENLW